jgi:predicted amidohydrolase YtcJ
VSLFAALAAHTQAGAAVAGLEADLGGIAAGKLADFVVLDSLGLGGSGERLAEVAVQRTYVGGRCRHGCTEPPAGINL